MTDTTRPEWMLSAASMRAAFDEKRLTDSHYRTGIRAQIAALEDVVTAMNRTLSLPLTSQWIANEIAALKKELSNE